MFTLRCVFGAYLGGTPPYLQCFLVDTDVYFASQAALSATMLTATSASVAQDILSRQDTWTYFDVGKEVSVSFNHRPHPHAAHCPR